MSAYSKMVRNFSWLGAPSVMANIDANQHIAQNIRAIVEYLQEEFSQEALTHIKDEPDRSPLVHAFFIALRNGETLKLRVRVSLLADKANSGRYMRGLLARADVATKLRENGEWDL